MISTTMTTISTAMTTTTPIAGRAGLVDGMGVEWQCVVVAPCTWTWCLFWQCQRSSEQRSHESVQFMISRRSFWLSPALFISVCDCALLLCFCLRPKWPLRGADYARRLHGAALPIQWRDARATRVAAGGSRPKSRSCDWRRRQRDARRADKKQKELMSVFLMCALRRGITCSRSIATDPINCNRSDVKQISQKPAEPIGTAVERLRRCLQT